ncbi:MAG: SPOCS domain-containing protein [Coprococcus sp.]
MELIKNKITTTNLKAAKYTQFTIDDDFNVSDAKSDIDKIITSIGNVLLEDIETLENKVRISGIVTFNMLYQSDDETVELENYEGDIPFEESVNVDGIMAGDKVDVGCNLEDLYVTMINSRKFEVRGLVGLKMWACEQVSAEGATGIMNGSGIECLNQKLPFTNNVASVKDIFKVREDIEIPAGKPNIGRLVWEQVAFNGIETRAVDDGVHISGKMELFAVYKPEEEMVPIQYVNSVKDFEGIVPCDDVSEDMILDDTVTVGKGNVSVKPDADGEDRVIQVEYNLNMDMKVYEDMELTVISDMYSPSAQIETETEQFQYENLLIRNNAKTKITHKEQLKSSQPQILQIVHISGNVDVDDIKLLEDAISVDGAVKAMVMYVSADDSKPVQQLETVIPFSYKVESTPLSEQDSVRITPSLDQISANMLGSDEVEIKAVINMSITVFARKSVNLITNINLAPIDMEEKAKMPGIVGYVVKEGDSIWSIAKQYYSSLDSIRQINELTSDEIMPGDRLVIVKD